MAPDPALDPALTSNEQFALNNGFSHVSAYLSVVPRTVLATANINQAITEGIYPLTQLIVNNMSANWFSAQEGATLDITNAGGTTLRGTYRLRNKPGFAGTNSVINIGEIGNGDWGLLNEMIRQNVSGNTVIQNGDKVTIWASRYDMWSAAPKILYPSIYTGGSFYEDSYLYHEWAAARGPLNLGEPIVNLGRHRSAFVDPGQNYSTMTFTANVLAFQGLFTPAYQWTIPSTWTITSGTSTSQTFTARVPAGFYTLDCRVRMDDGVSQNRFFTATRCVWSHFRGNFGGSTNLLPIGEILTDVRDRTGRMQTLRLPGDTITDLPYGTMVNYWEDPTWYIFDVPTATRNFTGWVVNRRWDTKPVKLENWEVDIEGPAGLLDRLGSYSQYVERHDAPDAYQEVHSDRCNLNYMIWYMLRLRAPNILRLFDHHPFSVSSLSGSLGAITAAASSSLLGQIQELARDLGCWYGHDSRGAAWVHKHPSLTTYSTRATENVLRDTLTGAKYQLGEAIREMKPKVRRVRGNQIFWHSGTASDRVQVFDAPGDAPGQGVADEEVTLAGSLVDADDETGHVLAMRNNPWPNIPLTIPGNRDVYEPAQGPLVSMPFMPSLGADPATRYGIPIRVTKRLTQKTCHIDLELEGETAGTPGVLVYTNIP